MRINRENTIGLVVDMQEKILPIIDRKEEVIKNSLVLLNGLKILKIPVIVTQQNTKSLGSTIPEINSVIGNYSYIDKIAFSCYREPDFVKLLARIGKRNVIILGIEAHVCVLQTGLDLLYNNYNPVVVEDCIGSSRENDKRVSLWRMRDVGVVITTYESILLELCREAGTEEFRALLKLFKGAKDA
jgi:nicotinamidase-related amidase